MHILLLHVTAAGHRKNAMELPCLLLWASFAPALPLGYFQQGHLCSVCGARREASSHHHTFREQCLAQPSQTMEERLTRLCFG